MKIEKAIKSDAGDLTEPTFRSKSHWDCSAAQMGEWRDDLTVSESDNLEKEVYKLANDNEWNGQLETSIKNRFLPIMELKMERTSTN